MINKNILIRIVAIGAMIGVMFFVDVLKINTATQSFKEYLGATKKVEQLNKENENLVNETSKTKKKLGEVRGADAVDLEDVNALYNAVTSIEGVESGSGKLLRISGEEVKILDDYSKEDLEKNNKADGVQIMIQVTDINVVLGKLGELKTPYTGLNVIYPEKKIVVTYNTRGGQL